MMKNVFTLLQKFDGIDSTFWDVMFSKNDDEGARMARTFYDQWTEKVKRTIPADRLLEFDVKQGEENLFLIFFEV